MSAVPPMPPTAAPGNVPNHLAWAIVSTVLATCLCCPLGLIGIVAIVFSTQVNSKLNQGDLEGAQRASASGQRSRYRQPALLPSATPAGSARVARAAAARAPTRGTGTA